jgi:hypothetical protein
VADIIAVEDIAPHAALVELLIDGIGNGTFAAAAQSGEPDDAPAMSIQPLSVRATNRVLVPDNDRRFFFHGGILTTKHTKKGPQMTQMKC